MCVTHIQNKETAPLPTAWDLNETTKMLRRVRGCSLNTSPGEGKVEADLSVLREGEKEKEREGEECCKGGRHCLCLTQLSW